MKGTVDPEREASHPIKLLLVLPVLSLLISCSRQNKIGTREIAVIPKPQAVTHRLFSRNGKFRLVEIMNSSR